MTTLPVYNLRNEKVSDIEVDDTIFSAEIKPSVFHEAVRTQLASERKGTAATKNKALVRGGGAKPWRQKGTGRARAGSRRSPLWRGGGTIFGPMPKDYSLNLPKKAKRAALKAALGMKREEGKLILLENFTLEGFKTRAVVEALGKFGVQEALIVTEAKNPFLERSARNIPGVMVVPSEGLKVYDILNHEYLILLSSAVERIQGVLAS